MDIPNALRASLSAEQNVRLEATRILEHASAQNFGEYLNLLAESLRDANSSAEVRMAAGLALKNALYSKHETQHLLLAQKWLALDSTRKESIRDQLVNAIRNAPLETAFIGTSIAQAVAAVGSIDLASNNAWPALVPCLLQIVTDMIQSASMNEYVGSKRCALEAIGFLCEQASDRLAVRSALEGHSAQLLTAITYWLGQSDAANITRASLMNLKKTAADALLNAVAFISANMHVPSERSAVFHIICGQILPSAGNSPAVVAVLVECLGQMASLYYSFMQEYMQGGLAQLLLSLINSPLGDSKSADEEEALVISAQAIEFWCSMCDWELGLDSEDSLNLVYQSSHDLISALLLRLPRVNELTSSSSASSKEDENDNDDDDDDDDEWDIHKAAATCLALVSDVIGEGIFVESQSPILAYVSTHLRHPAWYFREAAVMAFGSGVSSISVSDPQSLAAIRDILPFLCQMLSSDSSVAVQATCAWCIGRIVDHCASYLDPSVVQQHVLVSLQGILTNWTGTPRRVMVNVCWALMTLFIHFGTDEAFSDDSNADTSSSSTVIFESSFSNMLGMLFSLAQASGSAGAMRLAAAANSSLEKLLEMAPIDKQEHLDSVCQLRDVLVMQLVESFASSSSLEMQAQICVWLQCIVRKLSQQRGAAYIADRVIGAVLSQISRLDASTDTGCIEDVFGLVGTIVSYSPLSNIQHHIGSILQALAMHLTMEAPHVVLLASLGLLEDVIRALTPEDDNDPNPPLAPFADAITNKLFELLQSILQNASVHHQEGSGSAALLTQDYVSLTVVVSAIGDVVAAMGMCFAAHNSMPITLQALGHIVQSHTHPIVPVSNQGANHLSSNTDFVDESTTSSINWDLVDAQCALVEALLVSYTAIVQAVSSSGSSSNLSLEYAQSLLAFILDAVLRNSQRTEAMARHALGLVGDMAVDPILGRSLANALADAKFSAELYAFMQKPMPLQGSSDLQESTLSVQQYAITRVKQLSRS